MFRGAAHGQTPPARKGGVYLYRNLGNGKFLDVTEKAGLTNPSWGPERRAPITKTQLAA